MNFLKNVLVSFTHIFSALTVLLVVLIKCSVFEDITLGEIGTLLIIMPAVTSVFNCIIDKFILNGAVKYAVGAIGTTVIIYMAIAFSGLLVIELNYLITIFLMVLCIYTIVWCMEIFLLKKTVGELNRKLDNISKK